MPKMDGTGPQGKGPRSGRGMGRCKKASPEKNSDPQGKGRGMGRGKGLRNGKSTTEK
ncbi:MAG: DUF5320 domain-containing protein [Bacteroidales bacterium]|nr:DUF5320 domain-containing protein [Bacteroidales bacterium]